MIESKPLPPTSNAVFDCRATAALLKSVGMLVWVSHGLALVAASYRAWWPLLAWGLVVYFAFRVRFDAELLEIFARDPEAAPSQLDQWLSRPANPGRSIADRCEGARRLARNLVYALIGQFAGTAWFLWRSHL